MKISEIPLESLGASAWRDPADYSEIEVCEDGSVREWRPVVGDVGGVYFVSSDGEVRSSDRWIRCVAQTGKPYARFVPGRILRPGTGSHGYLNVLLWRNGTWRGALVHRLVARSFLGEIPDGMHVCHSDGNPSNNTVGNLRIDTPRSNSADALRHGTAARGTQHGCSKLTTSDVRAIRADLRSQRVIAADYGVHQAQVSRIKRGTLWSHVA